MYSTVSAVPALLCLSWSIELRADQAMFVDGDGVRSSKAVNNTQDPLVPLSTGRGRARQGPGELAAAG